MSDTVAMTPGERRELKALVRQRFKVLRSEMEARQRELAAGVDHEIVVKHEARDFKRQEIERLAQRRAEDAHREVCQAIEEAGDVVGTARTTVGMVHLFWPPDGREIVRRAALSDLDAKVRAAKLRLDREEVDLLQNLAIGALETEEARAFLRAIPTVSELVPSVRLAEIEAQLGELNPGD